MKIILFGDFWIVFSGMGVTVRMSFITELIVCCELIRFFCPTATWVCVNSNCEQASQKSINSLSNLGDAPFADIPLFKGWLGWHNDWRWWFKWDRKPKQDDWLEGTYLCIFEVSVKSLRWHNVAPLAARNDLTKTRMLVFSLIFCSNRLMRNDTNW